jgi:hypothetical protein
MITAGEIRAVLNVDINNPPASAIYERLGFTPIGRRARYERLQTYTSVRWGPGPDNDLGTANLVLHRLGRSGPRSANLAPYSIPATVTKEITAGRPSGIGRYSAASNQPPGVSRAPNTRCQITTGPREPRFMRS